MPRSALTVLRLHPTLIRAPSGAPGNQALECFPVCILGLAAVTPELIVALKPTTRGSSKHGYFC